MTKSLIFATALALLASSAMFASTPTYADPQRGVAVGGTFNGSGHHRGYGKSKSVPKDKGNMASNTNGGQPGNRGDGTKGSGHEK